MGELALAIARIARIVGRFVAIALTICAVGGIGLFAHNRYWAWQEDKILLTGAISYHCPTSQFPLTIAFNNTSTHTVERVYFSLQFRRTGRSTDLLKWHRWSSDKILTPGETYRGCWGLPNFINGSDRYREAVKDTIGQLWMDASGPEKSSLSSLGFTIHTKQVDFE